MPCCGVCVLCVLCVPAHPITIHQNYVAVHERKSIIDKVGGRIRRTRRSSHDLKGSSPRSGAVRRMREVRSRETFGDGVMGVPDLVGFAGWGPPLTTYQ